MRSLGGQALLALWLAASSGAYAAQEAGMRAAATPTLEIEGSSAPVPPNSTAFVREKLVRLTQPSDKATRALQIGYLKLKRVCDYSLHEKPAQSGAYGDASFVGDRKREDLAAVQQALEKVQSDYRQNSRITKNASCKYAPALQLFSAACRGFYDDSDRLAVADQAAYRLITQAQERLALYGQYQALEQQGCTRAGFNMKLWANEEKNLWPILASAPTVFKSLLPSATEN
ncbi:MAG: hypothetical protein QE279_06720 [Rhodoferax sp.]|nr:hypothetical protein [Rhodoferax sp.]